MKQYEHYFIIDGLTPEKLKSLKRSVVSLDHISSVEFSTTSGVLKIVSLDKNIEDNIRMACEINKCNFRIKLNNKDIKNLVM